jgi:hypothetical protein
VRAYLKTQPLPVVYEGAASPKKPRRPSDAASKKAEAKPVVEETLSEKIIRYGRLLEKYSTGESAAIDVVRFTTVVDRLAVLTVSAALLKSTDIMAVVNKLRKHEHADVKRLCISLRKGYMAQVEAQLPGGD